MKTLTIQTIVKEFFLHYLIFGFLSFLVYYMRIYPGDFDSTVFNEFMEANPTMIYGIAYSILFYHLFFKKVLLQLKLKSTLPILILLIMGFFLCDMLFMNYLNASRHKTYSIIWFNPTCIFRLIMFTAYSVAYSFIRGFLWLRFQKNQLEKEKLLQQQKEAELQKRLADLTLSALRSQINPHFIFNCLNSIKLYTSQNDIETASEYLTKFSKILRKVLDNSRNQTIPLSDEIEVLQLYIEMEAMRFKDKLKYSIVVQDVDADYIEIPPLLLQPYVENAIWHGLMNKEDGGHLEITAVMKNDSILVVTIKDDGVGRAKAMELKSKMATQHRSFGMEITAERLDLINKIYRTATSLTIDDLTDNEGRAAGTQVTIQIEIS